MATTLLAHEWIATAGGSENVFEQIRRAIPDHRAVCLWNDDPRRFPGVEQSWLASSPLRGRKAHSLPFMSSAWNQVSLADVNRVLVSSHAFGHHLASRAAEHGIPSFAYVHSPARYVWVPGLDARGNGLAGRAGRGYFRWLDRRKSSPDVAYAANSQFVSDRIEAAWQRTSTVVYPPVDIAAINDHAKQRALTSQDAQIAAQLPSEFILGASRFIEYKRLESAIDVGSLLDMPVVLAGAGPHESRVREYAAGADTPVVFLGRVSDSLLRELYQRASLFVFMAVEDFGIMPVEAIASGTPVLVNRSGGTTETVALTSGGAVADPDDLRDMATAAQSAMSVDICKATRLASTFSSSRFRDEITAWTAGRV